MRLDSRKRLVEILEVFWLAQLFTNHLRIPVIYQYWRHTIRAQLCRYVLKMRSVTNKSMWLENSKAKNRSTTRWQATQHNLISEIVYPISSKHYSHALAIIIFELIHCILSLDLAKILSEHSTVIRIGSGG